MMLDNYFEIGYVLKPHGLKGAISIWMDVDDPGKYTKMESVVIQVDNNPIPFFISTAQFHGKKDILQLEDITDLEGAARLKGCKLLLPLTQLPSLQTGQFYYHEVIGYQIEDINLGKLGIIQNIFSGGNQDLISMLYQDREVLIPINDETVGQADHQNKVVFVTLPQGLLDIYL